MKALSDVEVEEVIVVKASQGGFTESMALNLIGYHIAEDPCAILWVLPTLDDCEDYSKERFTPMARDTPAVAQALGPAKGRDSGNTLLHKQFPGGVLSFAAAASPRTLAGKARRIVIFSDVDRFIGQRMAEGDPVSLGRKRSRTFWNRKHVMESTTLTRKDSIIWREYEQTDMGDWEIPCPHCGGFQGIRWKQVKWPAKPENAPASWRPSEAWLECVYCQGKIGEKERFEASQFGEYRSLGEIRRTGSGRLRLGFHVRGPAFLFGPLLDMVLEFLDAKDFPDKLMVWTNTTLGEVWEPVGTSLKHEMLLERAREYPAEVPAPVVLLTAAVDVQDDRLEYEILGWTRDEKQVSIEYGILFGDPSIVKGSKSAPSVWEQLVATVMERDLQHEWGFTIRVRALAVDTGGHNTQAAYLFCHSQRRNKACRVFGIKGSKARDCPIVGGRFKPHRYEGFEAWLVGTHKAKDWLDGRLKISQPSQPGYCDFPQGRGWEEETFKQLTSEIKYTRYRMGQPYAVYELPAGRRNEALDCRVYNVFLFHRIASPKGLALLEERLRPPGLPPSGGSPPASGSPPEPPPPPAAPAPAPRKKAAVPRRSGWLARKLGRRR